MARNKDYFTSPRGRAEYPHIVKPDTKFDAEGKFKTNLIVPGPEAQEFKEAIDQRMRDNIDSIREDGKEPWDVNLPYEELEDGSFRFTFKSKAKGTTKDGQTFTRSVAIFDAQGTPITDLDQIGGGSIIRVSGEFYPWGPAGFGSGITLRINAVQVIDLQEYTPDAETYGFESEDGYVAGSSDRPEDDEPAMADEQAEPSAEDYDF